MANIADYFKLIRIKQWYKNIMIFIPLFFSLHLFEKELFLRTFLGFFVLCFVSSSSYIINDILDMEKDKYHPEKKKGPLITGKIKISSAIIISVFLLNLGLIVALFLSPLFLLVIFLLFLFLHTYNLFVRKIIFLDLIFISINFVIRSVAGVFLINRPVSPWVILSAFFLSLFLVSGKRSAELSLKDVKKYRPNFKKSDKKVLEFLSITSIACVFIFFSIYSILFERQLILIGLPITLYISLLFFHELHENPEKIRNPEKFIFDKKIIFAITLWLCVVLVTIYSGQLI